MNALLVALGGAIGALSRYGISLLMNRGSFPWGTLCVNLIGSFVIGLVVFCGAKQSWSQGALLFVVTGILGGFTTFSAFSLENLQLIQDGKIGQALAYGLGSTAIGLFLAYCGFLLAQKLTS